MSTIHYSEMLKLLEAADHENGDQTFGIDYLDCNRGKRTGGNWVHIDGAKKCGLPYNCGEHEMRGIIDANGKITAVHLPLIFQINGLIVYR